jgi:hypothetical protein
MFQHVNQISTTCHLPQLSYRNGNSRRKLLQFFRIDQYGDDCVSPIIFCF